MSEIVYNYRYYIEGGQYNDRKKRQKENVPDGLDSIRTGFGRNRRSLDRKSVV